MQTPSDFSLFTCTCMLSSLVVDQTLSTLVLCNFPWHSLRLFWLVNLAETQRKSLVFSHQWVLHYKRLRLNQHKNRNHTLCPFPLMKFAVSGSTQIITSRLWQRVQPLVHLMKGKWWIQIPHKGKQICVLRTETSFTPLTIFLSEERKQLMHAAIC